MPTYAPPALPAPVKPNGGNGNVEPVPKKGRKPRVPKAAGVEGADGETEKPEPKPNYTKKVGSKIAALSGKITEVRCLQTQLGQSSLHLGSSVELIVSMRSATMTKAYTEELQELENNIDRCKATCETWYAKRLTDEQVVDAEKTTFDDLVAGADCLIKSFGTSTKLIKGALAPH